MSKGKRGRKQRVLRNSLGLQIEIDFVWFLTVVQVLVSQIGKLTQWRQTWFLNGWNLRVEPNKAKINVKEK